MKSEERKAVITAYKERKSVPGIYAIRCEPSGQAWVGQWADVTTIKTRLWFGLRLGTLPNKTLMEAWRQHGESAFTFTVLETLDEEGPAYTLASALKARAAHWRAELNAATV